MRWARNRYKALAGQSVTELAVFGSVVIFVIGMILKTGLSVQSSENIELRAFRMALRESYKTGRGDYSGGSFSAGRNSASISLVEDRLSIDPSEKQGTRDRAPVSASGGASMSVNLFMESDPVNDPYDVSVFDLIINGQRFPLTTSGVVQNKGPIDFFSAGDIPVCTANAYGDLRGADVGACQFSSNRFYVFMKAYNGEEDYWCTSGCGGGWSEYSRFDLDFDGTMDFDVDNDAYPGGAAGSLADNFGWQWVRIEDTDMEAGMSVDIDGDLQEEQLLECDTDTIPVRCDYTDYQEGDYDQTANELTENFYAALGIPYHKPGLEPEVTAYSFTKDGTALRNEEGKLYAASPTGQFVRNTTTQDHIDIIERTLYLSNDTERFCDAGVPTDWSVVSWAQQHGVSGMTNPVEACGDCFSDANAKLTCMDLTGTTPVVFIRSRIRDQRRSKWVTMVQEVD